MKINATTHMLKAEGSEKIISNRQSPNCKAFSTTDKLPKDLIVHYTACSKDAALSTFLKPNSTSAHLVIDRDGTVYQLVPFNKQAYHAGYSVWDNLSGLNGRAIGIELVNFGWDVANVPAAERVTLKHKHKFVTKSQWHSYSNAQLTSLDIVTKLLLSTYDLSRILGHDDISAGRKQDPGPAFDWDRYRKAVFGRTSHVGKIFKTVGTVNLRAGDGGKYAVLKTLPSGYEVGLIETWNNWSKVYLANKEDEVTFSVINSQGKKEIRNKKIQGWIRSDLIQLK